MFLIPSVCFCRAQIRAYVNINHSKKTTILRAMILSCIDCCSLLLTGCVKTEDLEKCLICIKNECARYLRVIVRNIEPCFASALAC